MNYRSYELPMRTPILAATVLLAGCTSHAPRPLPDGPEDVAAVRAVLDRWVALLESGQVDSAAALTTSDCVFSYGGRRYTVSESLRGFRTMQDFRVRLDSVVTHVRGDVAYLVYSDEGSFKAAGVATTSREVGGIVFVREAGTWRIAQWTATSPPPTVP